MTNEGSGPAGGREAGGTAFLLAQVGGLAAARFTQRLQAVGMTPPQAGVLRVIAAAPGRSQQSVATQLGLLPSKLVSLVDDLEREGLVERRRDPADRRNHALHVTEGGAERLRQIGRLARAHGADLLEPLDIAERAVLAGLLRRLAAHHELTEDVHPGYRTLGRRVPGPQSSSPPRPEYLAPVVAADLR